MRFLFKAFPDKKKMLTKLFIIIIHQFDGTKIDSKMDNFSCINMGFFFKAFPEDNYIII